MAKKKRGRPCKLEKIDLEVIERIAGLGFNNEEIARIIGISPQTLYKYKANPEFLEALKRGKDRADEKVINAMYENALGGFKTGSRKKYRKGGELSSVDETMAKPDTLAQIFWLKNRRPEEWRDKQEIDLTMKRYLNMEFMGKTVAELEAEAEAIRNRRVAIS